MGSKRTVILIAALVVGAIASFALYSYVSGIEDKAYNNAQLFEVYTAAQPIPANTPGEQVLNENLLVIKKVPREVLPANFVADKTTILGKVAETEITQGQILVPGMFVDPSQATSTWSERLPVDRVAVQISLDQVRGMVGMLQPADKVTLMMTVQCAEEARLQQITQEELCAGGDGGSFVRFLYSNVEILNIGNGTASAVGADGVAAPAASGIITFSVPLDAAKRIVAANTDLWLALEPKNYVAPADAGDVTGLQSMFSSLTPQGPPANSSPYGPTPAG